MSEPKPVVKWTKLFSEQFEGWWHFEGSGMPPLPGEDAETHVRRISREAFMRASFNALENREQGLPPITFTPPKPAKFTLEYPNAEL